MSSLPKNYDACIFFMGELLNDARCLNIIRTLAANGKQIAAVSFGSEESIGYFNEIGVDFYPIKSPGNIRAFLQWRSFSTETNKLFEKIRARLYWAGDLYSLVSAKYFKKKSGGKIIYDSREIYSALGPLSASPVKQKVVSMTEKYLISHVDRFIVSGDLDGKYLKKHFRTEKPFHTIMNLPPFREKEQSNIIRQKYNIPDGIKIILYQGMILPGRGLIPIIKALPLLENFRLVVTGSGEYSDEIIRYAETLGVRGKLVMTGRIDYDRLHEWTCSADIGLCIIEPVSFSYQLALPNKLFEYAMAGIPALVSDLPAMREIIEKSGTGLLVKHDANPVRIASAVIELAMMKNSPDFIKNAARTARKFSYENQSSRIMEIINDNG